MVFEGVVGDLGQVFFKAVQVGGGGDYPAVGPPEAEVSETQLFHQKGTDCVTQCGGVLVHETGRYLLGQDGIVGFGAGQQQGDVEALLADALQQIHACLPVQVAPAREAHIRDHSQDIILVGFIEIQGFLVIARQQDLGAGPHGEQAVLVIEPHVDHRLGFDDQFPVEHRQQGGEVEGRVFPRRG